MLVSEIENLYEKAAKLAGRSVEVSKTTDGKFIVMWMNFDSPPPPKAESEETALTSFIDFMSEKAKTEPAQQDS